MPLPRTIAIDGPAGSGKSSVSSRLARELGYVFVDTGAFYRMVTLAALEANLLDSDEAQIVALVNRIQMDIRSDASDDRQYTALLDCRDVTAGIRDAAVDANVSRLSAMPQVRAQINIQQRAIAARGGVIMAGRDIGTVVLPDADLKLYLDASSDARALRRYQQSIADGQPADLDAITQAMRARDTYDSTRKTAPLTQASDAHYVDTDGLTIDEVVDRIKKIIQDRQA